MAPRLARLRRRYWLVRTRKRERALSRELLELGGGDYLAVCDVAIRLSAVRAIRRRLELNP